MQIEREALRNETDKESKKRLATLEKQLADLQGQFDAMQIRWESQTHLLRSIKELREEIEQKNTELEQAQRSGELEKAARIQYGELRDLQARLGTAEEQLEKMCTEGGGLTNEEVTSEQIADVVAQWTHIPVTKLLESERDKLLHMEEDLRMRVIGQDEALVAVANAIRRSRAGLSDPQRPIGSFLFLGPTGVGKTELCRALADLLFDTDEAMVRLDMSEFMESHSVARLIGAPPGYVGYDEGGRLTEAVRRKPYCVILFDEIEKAHSDVFNVLLQVLDDGRLTDGQGRTVDFKNTLIVMTSNIASEFIQELAEGQAQQWEIEAQLKEALRAKFRPEFLNRIDETVVFHSLSKADLEGIVEIQVRLLARRLSERQVSLSITPAAKDLLCELGYDPTFGARPLKRTIQREIENPLAQKILAGEAQPGQKATVDSDGRTFSFSVE